VYKRTHHQEIGHVLRLINAERLQSLSCYFGGGTAIALRYGEYRESVDIDFLVSKSESYRHLRQEIRQHGLKCILIKGALEQIDHGDIRVDRYGIRTQVRVAEQWIKFEIVHEGRMELLDVSDDDEICGVKCLTLIDMVSSKLLANSDRWLDRGVFSRDLIDLAMLSVSQKVFSQAVDKSSEAYGDSIVEDLHKAIEFVKTEPQWLDRCMKSLSMDMPKAMLWKKIRDLQKLKP
jgi:hypothetical protein